jgi:hypothetical protein
MGRPRSLASSTAHRAAAMLRCCDAAMLPRTVHADHDRPDLDVDVDVGRRSVFSTRPQSSGPQAAARLAPAAVTPAATTTAVPARRTRLHRG